MVVGQATTGETPVIIGVTPRIHHADPTARGSYRQTLYISQSAISDCIARAGALVVTLPSSETISADIAQAYAARLDGLLLQGGADISPLTYSETPLRSEWSGDARRDAAELAYFEAFFKVKKPILGLCRGCQLINVALGGTLHQDLRTQRLRSIAHSDHDLYSEHTHGITLDSASLLFEIYGVRSGTVNSIHHQGIARLAQDLVAEAHCTEDGLIEGIRHRDASRFVVGVQWHAELMADVVPPFLKAEPLFDAFVAAARRMCR
jgi:putative glutamine amidotransferase